MRYLIAVALLTACSSSSVPAGSLDASADATDPTDARGGLTYFCETHCMPSVACPDTTTARCAPRSDPADQCDRCAICVPGRIFTLTLVCDPTHSPGGAAFSCMSSSGAYVQAVCSAP